MSCDANHPSVTELLIATGKVPGGRSTKLPAIHDELNGWP